MISYVLFIIWTGTLSNLGYSPLLFPPFKCIHVFLVVIQVRANDLGFKVNGTRCFTYSRKCNRVNMCNMQASTST